MAKKLKLATAFSGIGSIEHALHRLNINHKLKFACDIDKFVKQSYFANYDIDDKSWYNDVSEIDGAKYKNKIDLFVGGSPCQSFSMVGKRKGLNDERGLLVYEFIRLVDEIKPKVFIFENVKGLLSHDSGKTWLSIQKRFEKLGYHINHTILNARDFNIPQNRQRLFVVGFLEKVDFKFPEKQELKYKMSDFLEFIVDEKYFLPEKGVKFVQLEKNLKKKYTQINGDIALCQKANQQFNWHGDFIKLTDDIEKFYLSDKVKDYVLSTGTKNFRTNSTEIDLDVARPLLSTMAKMHRAGVDNYISSNNGKIRKLTPRECLRLMGFSDNFKIVVSNTQMYKQAGNSVVVDVLINILEEIYKTDCFNV